ncbi:hypothetical protein [Phenylobacterium ferrooxidans]|uniref:Tip attachment protein J domain-containing protein n=1 Tax=Phenylobacterium ferrooxidans TaxID=2982689 RepID=A0ABW6CJS6_9CAUL
MGTVILVEIDVVSPAGAASTLRFSDRAIRPFPPGDPDRAGVVWDDRLAEAPTFRRALFGDLESLSPALGAGSMTLLNGDAYLDAYQGYAFNEIRVWRWTEGTAFAAADLVLKGLCVLPAFDSRSSQAARVRLDLYDYRAELELAVQPSLYSGGNNGTTILYEGSADGLKGRVKPLAFGDLTAAHLPPIQVNAGNYVFQLHEALISGAEAIFDGGAAAGYADQGDKSSVFFDANTPSAASYFMDLTRGLMKINGAPVKGLTFGCKGDATGSYVETAGPIAARILAHAGVPGGRIGSSVAALSSTAVVGVFSADTARAGELVAWTVRGALTAVLPDRLGVYQAVTFAAPKVTADVGVAADQVLNLEADDTAPAPIGEIRVGWGRIWTTFGNGELKDSVRNTATAERLAAEYRWAVDTEATVKGRFPRAWRTLTVETALRVEADAIALAASLKALFGLRGDGKPRRLWRVTISLLDGLTAQLGETVALSYPAKAINDNFVLIAEEPLRPRRDQAIWTLWG